MPLPTSTSWRTTILTKRRSVTIIQTPAPDFTRMGYGEMRRYADSLGVTVCSDHLPDHMQGLYSAAFDMVVIDRDIDYTAKRCTGGTATRCVNRSLGHAPRTAPAGRPRHCSSPPRNTRSPKTPMRGCVQHRLRAQRDKTGRRGLSEYGAFATRECDMIRLSTATRERRWGYEKAIGGAAVRWNVDRAC